MKYVLLVEDNRRDKNHVTAWFGDSYHDVELVPVPDGNAALKWINSNPTKHIALIITDINMNPMNGHKFVEKIKKIEQLKYTPVVIFTGSNYWNDRKKMLNQGILAYHVKPDSMDDRAKVIRSILNYWLIDVSPPSKFQKD